MKYGYSFLIITALFFCLTSCQNSNDSQEEKIVIADIGERSVDWQQLWLSYHLEPKWGRGLTTEESFNNQLEYLVEQKLFAQAAISEGALADPRIAGQIAFIEEKEAIKALYRKHVESKVEIQEAAYEQAYHNSKTKVQFQYIKTTDSLKAADYLVALGTKTFEEIIVSPTDEKAVSPMFTFGDMAEPLEEVVFQMQLDEIRGPIKVDDQFMVVKLINGERDVFRSKMELAEKKSKLKKVLFERRAKVISDRYVAQILQGKKVTIHRDAFIQLAKTFNQVVQQKQSDNSLPLYLDNNEIKETRSTLKDFQDDLLITFTGGSMTIREFLENLFNMPTGLRPQVNMAPALKKALYQAVRNHYLAEAAAQEGLGETAEVQSAVESQTDAILARFRMQQMRNSLTVSEAEIEKFQNSEAFARLNNLSKGKLNNSAVKDVLLDFKFKNARIEHSDSLRKVYTVSIQQENLSKQIDKPDELIAHQPVRMYYRENFH